MTSFAVSISLKRFGSKFQKRDKFAVVRCIEQLEVSFDKERLKFHEKMEQERLQWSKSIEFLKNQILLKDNRIDVLLEAVQAKDSKFEEVLGLILSCPCRKSHETK